MPMNTSIQIYAHVGLRATRRERERRGRGDIALWERPWPLQWVNVSPLDAYLTAQHVGELREQVSPDRFAGFAEATFPTTRLPALSLAFAAYEEDTASREAVSWALRDALFESALDISEPDVLFVVAQRFDLRPGADHTSAIESEWRLGQLRGFNGSPHFFCGDSDAFYPSLDITRRETVGLELHTSVEALSVFLRRCGGDPDR